MNREEIKLEWLKCSESCAYFLDTYGRIYDATQKEWIPFQLWYEQYLTLNLFVLEQLIIALKARQLGLTWLALGNILWMMLFQPNTTALVFSRRDTEAIYLLSKERLRGMYNLLPRWMQARDVTNNSAHEWALSNGSIAYAFPTSAGDSYTASVALVDEADLVPDLGRLLGAVKPTIDGGGKLFLISRSDKSRPNSEFKNIYRGARSNETAWKHIFLPWFVRPSRDEIWYEIQKQDVLARTGSLDDLHEQYPATDDEALSARTLDKRIAPIWLHQCFVGLKPFVVENEVRDDVPAIPGLKIYRALQPGRRYVIGGDPAEGNPTSDDSSCTVLDFETGEECASLRGKLQPSTFAAHIDVLGHFYNKADVLVERNNHGHAVLLWLSDNSELHLLSDEENDPRKKRPKPGWLNNSRGKTLLYDIAADAFRDMDTICHDFISLEQLSSIEGSTLLAPEGLFDDAADSYALALAARTLRSRGRQQTSSWSIAGLGKS